jgi:predicted DNA-binding protein
MSDTRMIEFNVKMTPLMRSRIKAMATRMQLHSEAELVRNAVEWYVTALETRYAQAKLAEENKIG